MKQNRLRLLGLIVGTFWAGQAPAQSIANQSFENWTMRRGIEAPDGWQTADDLVEELIPPFVRINSGAITKTTDARSGTYALQLRNTLVPSSGSVPLMGMVALGVGFRFEAGAQGGFGGAPYTGPARPTSLEFYYKLSGPQALADEPIVTVSLTRTAPGSSMPAVIAYGEYWFSARAAAYTKVTVPLLYMGTGTPDSLRINIWSGTTSPVTDGSTLLIDDLELRGGITTAVAQPAVAVGLHAFPNPSADGRFTLSAADPALLAAPYTVLDVLGRIVAEGPAAPPAASRPLVLTGAAPGLYTLRLHTPQGVVARKLTVR